MVGVAGSLATEVLILRIEKGCLILIGLANESVARTYVRAHIHENNKRKFAFYETFVMRVTSPDLNFTSWHLLIL